MANYYDELLKLCGFEDDEINGERPRLEKAFQKLELGPEDMNRAIPWVREQHDVELVGVRKLLRVWILELIDLVLARDEGRKIVYFGFPPIIGPSMAIKAVAPEKIWSGCPEIALCLVMGQVFNKLTPILESGEENGLPPGHSLCSLLQIKVGGIAKGILPVPDLISGASYYCDMGPKADELLAEKYGVRAVYPDNSMDSAWGEYPDFRPERVKFFGAQLNGVFEVAKEVLGVEVTPQVWEKVMDANRRFYRSLGQLSQLMLGADPIPMSTVETNLAVNLMGACTGRAMTEGPEAMDILTEEVKQRVDKGIGVVEKGAPKVSIGLNHLSDPRITHMMEKAGIAPIATAYATPSKLGGSFRKAPTRTLTTIGEIRAERELIDGRWHSFYADVARAPEVVGALNVDGVIRSYLFSCRPSAVLSHNYKLVQEETGIPHLSLEIDLYDSRNYSAEALRTRVETFAEMLRARKVAK